MTSGTPEGVVVVTGAAGALGRRVLRLLDADPDVRAVVGVDIEPVASTSEKFVHRRLDLATDELAPALEGATAVVHLASSWGTDGGEEAGARVNVQGTKRLLAAAGASGVRDVVALSSATVYGAWPTNPLPLTEDAPLRPNPGFAYAAQKAEAERLLAEWADAHADAAVATLRPTVVLAEDATSWIARALVAAAGIRAGETDPPVQFLHLDDLAAAVDLARRARLSGPFNVAPEGWIPGETALALAGATPRVRLPTRVATRLAELSWELRLGPLPPGLVPYTVHPWVVANDRLRAAGWAPRWTNEEAFVAGHEGSRWAMMSPKRRQELALGATGLTLLAGAAGVAWMARRATRGSS